jgi:hypothetical protein
VGWVKSPTQKLHGHGARPSDHVNYLLFVEDELFMFYMQVKNVEGFKQRIKRLPRIGNC